MNRGTDRGRGGRGGRGYGRGRGGGQGYGYPGDDYRYEGDRFSTLERDHQRRTGGNAQQMGYNYRPPTTVLKKKEDPIVTQSGYKEDDLVNWNERVKLAERVEKLGTGRLVEADKWPHGGPAGNRTTLVEKRTEVACYTLFRTHLEELRKGPGSLFDDMEDISMEVDQDDEDVQDVIERARRRTMR